MIINENTRNKLLSFDETQDTYTQFEEKCKFLSNLTGFKIDPISYKIQYGIHEKSLDEYVSLQTELYEFLHSKYPNVEFSMSGRLKTEFSHYEKVIRKLINLIQKDELNSVQIFDDYAMKVNVRSVSYDVDKISVDDDGVYIDSGADQFRIVEPMTLPPEYAKRNKLVTDAFEFDYNGKLITAIVYEGQKNIVIDNNVPYIYTSIDGKGVKFPLNSAKKYIKSFKDDLIPYCQSIQEDVSAFLNNKGFQTKKRKDYIKAPKKSGYMSIQCSYYSEEESLGIECQTRTYDMDLFSNWERKVYKPAEKKISLSSLDRIPQYVYTTAFPDGVHSLKLNEAECFELIYNMSLKEYRKKIHPFISPKATSNRLSKEEEEPVI